MCMYNTRLFKALNSLVLLYISELLCPHSTSRSLGRSDQLLLASPSSSLRSKGDRAFAVAAPKALEHFCHIF